MIEGAGTAHDETERASGPPEGWAEHVRHCEVDGIQWAPKDCLICSGIHMHHVTLTCGHEFDEMWSGEFDTAKNQMRACGHPDHYPAQFQAMYRPITEGGDVS